MIGLCLRLRDSGRRLVLINLGHDESPFIDGVLVYHLPIQEEQPPLPPENDTEDTDDRTDTNLYANLTPRQRYLLRRAQEAAKPKEADHAE